jgi:hypothetical protein
MNPNWYPGYYFDPKNMWEWMPDVMDHWLPASLVRTPPEIPPASWPEPSFKPSYGLLDDLAERVRPKSLEERLAALPTLLPDVVATPAAPQSNARLWGGLLPLDLAAQWPDASPVSMPSSMPTAQSSPPPMPGAPGVVPTLGGGPLARIAGWPYDVPRGVPVLPVQWPSSSPSQPSDMPSAPPAQHVASANYWGATPTTGGPLSNYYLAPVPPAPNWDEVPTRPTASEAEIFPQPKSPLSWNAPPAGGSGDHSGIDEAAEAERARRAAAMRTGQWRRGVEERNGRLGEASTTVPASQKTWSADELRPQYAEQAELVASILNRRPDDLVWRGSILPVGSTRDERITFALPEMLAGPVRSVVGPMPQADDREGMIEKALPLAGLAMAAGRLPGSAPPGAIGTFVGQKGASKLNQGGLHPVVDPAKAISDVEAQGILQARRQAGDLRDVDIWERSGWHWGPDGKLKKEIPDTGSWLEATGKRQAFGQEFILRHPAGDIHGVYDIKPMVIGPRVGVQYGRGTAFFDEATGRIYIDGDMTTPAGVARAHKVALEEIQHAIQAREGFARGMDPRDEVYFPEYWQALGRRMPNIKNEPAIFRRHQEIIERGVRDVGERNTPEFEAAIATYKRVAGEAEADNVRMRFEEPHRYRQHPSETAKVSPQRQIVRDPRFQMETINDAYRWGAFKPPYD